MLKENIKWSKGEPLKTKALREMRRVMDGILSGELKHDQSSWHEVEFYETNKPEKGEGCSPYNDGAYCNSSHCFAGWVEVIGKKSDRQKKSFLTIEPSLTRKMIEHFKGNGDSGNVGVGFDDAEQYTEERFGLTSFEANVLFWHDNTKRELNSIVKKFEKGYRASEQVSNGYW